MKSFQGRGFSVFLILQHQTYASHPCSRLHSSSRPVSNLRNELTHTLCMQQGSAQSQFLFNLRLAFLWTQPLRNAPQKFPFLVTSGPSLCGMLRKTSILVTSGPNLFGMLHRGWVHGPIGPTLDPSLILFIALEMPSVLPPQK